MNNMRYRRRKRYLRKKRYRFYRRVIKLCTVFLLLSFFVFIPSFFMRTASSSSKDIISSSECEYIRESFDEDYSMGDSSTKQDDIRIESPIEYSNEEEIMMRYIVECEAHDLSIEHKTMIACVIIKIQIYGIIHLYLVLF